MKEEFEDGKINFLAKDIYDIDVDHDLGIQFDIIILKDVIEHIHNQERFMNELKKFLKPNGIVFFGFPPWMMPFGGHQQISSRKILSVIPYYHLLPMPVYKGMLKLFGEKPKNIEALAEIKETGISIERFEKICRKEKYEVLKKKYFLTNPIYQYKFGLKVRKQAAIISAIPWVRNFLTTCVYYVIRKK
jgi:2-polyprenyl-3-methyl-5-hydroxy-6-metoxy-1,4-benzoquinol methylase